MAGGVKRDDAVWKARPTSAARGGNVYVEIEIPSFEEAVGTHELVRYEAQVRCKVCVGRGTLSLPDPECEICDGTGWAHLDDANGPGIERCPACLAEPCPNCGGAGTIMSERCIRLPVPAGVENGTLLRVSGDGNDAGAGSIPGDLLVRIHLVEPPPPDSQIVRYAAFAFLVVAIASLVLYLMR